MDRFKSSAQLMTHLSVGVILIYSLFITVNVQAQLCATHASGDADCSGKTDLRDYEIWRREYLKLETTTKADFNGVGGVDLIDYETWRRAFVGGGTNPPPPPTATPAVTVPPSQNNRWETITPPGVAYQWDGTGSNYGFHFMASDPRNAGVIYLGTSGQGFYKSSDSGTTWRRIDGGVLGGRSWAIAVDPRTSAVYTSDGYGKKGLFKSSTGESNFTDILASGTCAPSTPTYSIAIDPNKAGHILATFHNQGGGTIVETLNEGASWRCIPGGTFGGANYVFFLNNSETWLAASQNPDLGIFKTTDSGATWTNVLSNAHVHHGATQLYKSPTGAYYLALSQGIFKSTDNGDSWTKVLAAPRGNSVWGPDGFMGVMGDGARIFTHVAELGAGTTTGQYPYMVTPESSGTQWTAFNDQTFTNGPSQMAFDSGTGYLYSANWGAGVFRLKLR